VTLAIIVTAAACSTGSKPRVQESSFPLLPGDSRVEHAVQSEELRQAMVGLEKITTDRLPDKLERGPGRRTNLEEIARLADALSRTAAGIPDALSTNPLPAEDTRRFRELSEQLVRDAMALRDRAILGEVGSARDETEKLLATCNACHAFARVTPTATAAVTAPTPTAPIPESRSEEPATPKQRRSAGRHLR
jgi:cytochrome c556